MNTSALRQNSATYVDERRPDPQGSNVQHKGFPPHNVSLWQSKQSEGSTALQMYTEEQVSAMLQVSLSQLRKWRMKSAPTHLGPPFRKVGRLVRYPKQALEDYINGSL